MSNFEVKARKLRKARNGGRALFAVFGVLAVVGNVQAAPATLSSQLWHALPPVAFMLSVEVAIVWVPEFSERAARIAYAATAFIATASFALSYMSLHHVAHDAGMGWGAWLFPILFEVTALTFSGVGIAASRALVDAEDARADAEHTRVEVERARVEVEQRAAERSARAEREAIERAQREAMKPAPEPSQAERDALVLRERYGDTLPTYKAVNEALGWSAGKQKAAREAYAAMGPAPAEPALV